MSQIYIKETFLVNCSQISIRHTSIQCRTQQICVQCTGQVATNDRLTPNNVAEPCIATDHRLLEVFCPPLPSHECRKTSYIHEHDCNNHNNIYVLVNDQAFCLLHDYVLQIIIEQIRSTSWTQSLGTYPIIRYLQYVLYLK